MDSDHGNKEQKVNKLTVGEKRSRRANSREEKGLESRKDKVQANFTEDSDNFVMEVNAEQEQEFQSSDEEADISFNTRRSDLNNNASPARDDLDPDTEGEIFSESEEESQNEGNELNQLDPNEGKEQAKEQFVMAMLKEKEKTKSEFVDAAMAKFQEDFMKSGFMETASKLQKQLEDTQKFSGNAARLKVSSQTPKKSQGNHRGSSGRKELLPSKDEDKLNNLLSRASVSELMVYRNAVENQINKKHHSDSSETDMDCDERCTCS